MTLLRPDYDKEEENIDDIDDDEIDFTNESIEEYKQEIINQNKKMTVINPFTSPSPNNRNQGQGSWPNSGWGNCSNSSSPTWPNNQPTWGNSVPTWGQGSHKSWSGGERKELPRNKSIIIIELLDCLVETFQSNNRPGLIPRGTYDLKLKFDVWDKINCINPKNIYICIPSQFVSKTDLQETNPWEPYVNYIVSSLTQYLRIPINAAQLLVYNVFNPETKINILKHVITNDKLEDMLYIGIESGLNGQSNKDLSMAELFNLDYIDLNQLLTLYN